MNLRDWREREGINQTELADRLGVTAATVSRIENGEFVPSGPLLVKIESETSNEVTPNDILEVFKSAKDAAQ